MGRYKALMDPHLHARNLAGQSTEAAVGMAVLNRMFNTARRNSVRCTAALPEIGGRATRSPDHDPFNNADCTDQYRNHGSTSRLDPACGANRNNAPVSR